METTPKFTDGQKITVEVDVRGDKRPVVFTVSLWETPDTTTLGRIWADEHCVMIAKNGGKHWHAAPSGWILLDGSIQISETYVRLNRNGYRAVRWIDGNYSNRSEHSGA